MFVFVFNKQIYLQIVLYNEKRELSRCLTCFSGSRWPGRCATHRHKKGLGKSDIASVREGSDDKSLCTSEELVLIFKADVGDVDDTFVCVLVEVEANLLEPLKVRRSSNMHTALVQVIKEKYLLIYGI